MSPSTALEEQHSQCASCVGNIAWATSQAIRGNDAASSMFHDVFRRRAPRSVRGPSAGRSLTI